MHARTDNAHPMRPLNGVIIIMSTSYFNMKTENEIFSEEQLDEGAFRAVGHIARAVTYSPISNGYPDLTLRELYALSSLPHVETLYGSYTENEEPIEVIDTADIFIMYPGMVQGFIEYSEIIETLSSLEKRGLVGLERFETAPRMQGVLQRDYSVRARLTERGRSLMDSICGNINKVSVLFDDAAVRQGLERWQPA